MLALGERLIPRLLAAGLTFVLAILTDPTSVGVYSAALLVYTLVQALTENTLRQIAPSHLSESRHDQVVRWAWGFSIAGGIIMGVACCLIGGSHSVQTSAYLSPIAAAPVFGCFAVIPTSYLQIAGRWRTLVSARFVSSVAPVPISFALLLWVKSPFGAAFQLCASEAINLIICCLVARRWGLRALVEGSRTTASENLDSRLNHGRDVVSMTLFSGLGWAQGQIDRVLVGAVGGLAALGSYSFASSLARTPGDALGASTANLVRARLVSGSPDSSLSSELDALFGKAVLLAAGCAVGMGTASLLLSKLLNEQWHSALQAVPLLAVSCVPASLNWCVAPVLLSRGRSFVSVLPPLIGILFAPLVTLVIVDCGLLWGSSMVLAREIATLSVGAVLTRRFVPAKAYLRCYAVTAITLVLAVFIVGAGKI